MPVVDTDVGDVLSVRRPRRVGVGDVVRERRNDVTSFGAIGARHPHTVQREGEPTVRGERGVVAGAERVAADAVRADREDVVAIVITPVPGIECYHPDLQG